MEIDRNIKNYTVINDITTPLKTGDLVTMLYSSRYSTSRSNPKDVVGKITGRSILTDGIIRYRVKWYFKDNDTFENSSYIVGKDIIKIKLKYPITYTINKIKFSII